METSKELKFLFKLAGWSAIILMIYSLATILIVSLAGGPPQSVKECFEMLRENRTTGLLRLDILTVFVMPLYFILFYALYVVLKPFNHPAAAISMILVVTGVTLFLAAPSVFSYLRLSDSFWIAASETEKLRISAAAEAVLATDIWNGTGPRIGGLLVQTGATVLSVIMLRSSSFSRLTSYTGIATHGLDLLHVIIGFAIPSVANGIMAVAGVLYLLWFPLITVALFRLANDRANA